MCAFKIENKNVKLYLAFLSKIWKDIITDKFS